MESRFSGLVIDALFPRFCLGCRKEGTMWCDQCASNWWPVVWRVGCPFCGRHGSAWTCVQCRSDMYLDGLSVFASYRNPVVREAIVEWKYRSDREYESVLYSWLTRAQMSLCPPFLDFVLAPVPLHVRKRRLRGFDQAGVMTDWLAQLFSQPAYDLLIRQYANISQAQRVDRSLGSLDGLFVMNPAFILFGDPVPERVVLCDDVFTSGATMDAAARCLKEVGVKHVWGIVIAKGSLF